LPTLRGPPSSPRNGFRYRWRRAEDVAHLSAAIP
jgi:hypothetical protein